MLRAKMQRVARISFAMFGTAPSHDTSVELLSCASIPPVTVAKNNWEWNDVLSPFISSKDVHEGTFFGGCSVIPFRFRHPSPLPRGLKRPARTPSRSPHIRG